MTWNYRVMEFEDEYGTKTRAIHEVYYDEEGKPEYHTMNPCTVDWDPQDADDPREILGRMLTAFDKPMLTPKDFERSK